MTSYRDSHNTTDVKPEMIPGLYTGNGIPHDEYNLCGIVHKHTNRKDDIFMQRRLYIDEPRTTQGAGHIPLKISRFRSAIYRRCGHFSFPRDTNYLITIKIYKIIHN